MRAAVVFCLALVASAAFGADTAPTPLSTDAQATVYLNGDFRKDFYLEYATQFWGYYRNRGWSTLTISFLGGPPPSDEVTIGLFGVARSAHVFTALSRDGKRTFRDRGVVCAPVCRLSLRGNRNGLSAYVDDIWLASWPRFWLRSPAPAVQLTAEVSTPGDRFVGSLDPERTTLGGRKLGIPTCGFTARGISVDEAERGRSASVGPTRRARGRHISSSLSPTPWTPGAAPAPAARSL